MKVLVIEDHRDIAENIGDYLEPRGHVLDYAPDGRTGLALAIANRYDAIVLDVMLPGLDGVTLCRRLREEAKLNVPVLMLTARDRLADKEAGFMAGADDYLVKPFSLKELELRLLALHRRSVGSPASRVLRVADLVFDPDSLGVARAGRPIDLNPAARKLLRYLMERSNRVVPREELETLLWKDDPPEGDVLRSHIYALRAAIDRPFAVKLLHTVHGTGYRLTDPEARQT